MNAPLSNRTAINGLGVRWACGLAILAIAALYLSQWIQMPLYQDEVALRVLRGRFLVDGATDYGLFAQCASNIRTIASIFWPVAWLYAAFDAAFGWAGVRALPVAVVLFALGIVLVQILGARVRAASLVLLAGLIGVAGSGLVLSRMEAPTLLFGAVCLTGYVLIRRPTVSPLVQVAFLVFATLVALFALFIHPQAMVFVPIILLLAGMMVVRSYPWWARALACLSVACVAVAAVAAWDNTSLHCPEMPALESQFDQMGLPGLVQERGLSGVQANLQGKFARYAGNFLFRKDYDVGYLPGIELASGRGALFRTFLNGAIWAIVLLNLLFACGVAIVAAYLSVRRAFRAGRRLHEQWLSIAFAPSTFLFLASSSHLALFVYDTPTNFYRAFYIHFVLAAVNALALSGVGARFGRAVFAAGAVALVVCTLSVAVVRQDIRPKFLAGWEGPSISLRTEWSSVNADVQKVAARCDLGPDLPRVVIDDMTYDGMKHHRHLLPLRWIVLGQDFRNEDRADPLQFFRGLSATGIVAQCKSFDAFHLPASGQVNGFCCLKF